MTFSCVFLRCIQLASVGGVTTFYISQSTYPSAEYFDMMVVSSPGHMGVMFVAQPPTEDVEGLVYCNIAGDNQTQTNISIGVLPGGNSIARTPANGVLQCVCVFA